MKINKQKKKLIFYSLVVVFRKKKKGQQRDFLSKRKIGLSRGIGGSAK